MADQITVLCDLCGKPGVRTYVAINDENAWQYDRCSTHETQFYTALTTTLTAHNGIRMGYKQAKAARRRTLKTAPYAAIEGLDQRAVRQWAMDVAGLPVAPKGRIHTSVIELYRTAHETPEPSQYINTPEGRAHFTAVHEQLILKHATHGNPPEHHQ